MKQTISKGMKENCIKASLIFGSLLIFSLIVVAIPTEEGNKSEVQEVVIEDTDDTQISDLRENFKTVKFEVERVDLKNSSIDYYNEVSTRGAVEWFYNNVTGNAQVTNAILQEASKNDIPLSLAFALAFTESHFDTKAENVNKNASIDRGIFQLNNRSFPQLKEKDFFNPAISARYGLAHLRFCLNTAGNTVAGLAMYNAGTNKVRGDRTPQSTLNYIGKIMEYKGKLDLLFEEEVAPYIDNSNSLQGLNVAYLGASDK